MLQEQHAIAGILNLWLKVVSAYSLVASDTLPTGIYRRGDLAGPWSSSVMIYKQIPQDQGYYFLAGWTLAVLICLSAAVISHLPKLFLAEGLDFSVV